MTLVKRLGMAIVAILALFGGYSAFGGVHLLYKDLAFLREVRVISEQRAAEQRAAKAKQAASQPPADTK